MNQDENDMMYEELEQFKKEKERIRALVGQIGGKHTSRNDKLINLIFVSLLILLFIVDILHVAGVPIPVSTSFTIILAILMVSIKMIWMMHKSSKVNHFQFWMLSSIEFRLNEMAKRIRYIENNLNKNENGGSNEV